MKYTPSFLINKIPFLLLFSIFYCCKNFNPAINCTDLAQFKAAAKYYNIVDFSNWKVDQTFIQDSNQFWGNTTYTGGFYYYNKAIGDTSYWLAFEFYTSINDTIFSPIEFYKRYQDEFYQYVLLFGKNGDSLFFYKAPLYRDLKKIFISGKYYYQYLFNELTPDQRKFFNQYKDSLIKVKGNNLEPLPE